MKKRLPIYLAILVALPLFGIMLSHTKRSCRLDEIREEIASLYFKAAVRERKQQQNRLARNKFHGADHFYIDKELETLRFLQPEVELLQAFLDEEPNMPSKDVSGRLNTLLHHNRLTFDEGRIESYAQIQETTESLTRPIELNTEDLQTLLSKIESAKDAPQLLVTNFGLTRKNNVFSLDLTLIKREYL